MPKILVTGANGQLGNELKKISRKNNLFDFLYTDIEDLDITNETELNHFLDHNPASFIINCAGYTAVDRAEEESGKAYEINGKAVKLIGQACKDRKMQLVHISTDYVFDGKKNLPYNEEDKPEPLSVYGKSKLAGENYLKELNVGIIIRTSWLYSSSGNNFVKTILRLAKGKNELKIVSDQIGTPTWAADLAQTIMALINIWMINKFQDKNIIFHYSNEGMCTWYDFAIEIIKMAGLETKIIPIGTSEYPVLAERPLYSVLNKDKIRSYLNLDIPLWTDSLIKCMTEINQIQA